MPAVKRPKRLRKNIKTNCINRQEQVGRMYCQGLSQHSIAEQLGVSQPTVCNDLVAVRERWKANAEKSYVIRLNEELAKLDAVEEAAWESYRRSCQEAVTVTTEKMPVSVKAKKGEETKPSKKVVVTKHVEQRRGQAGDASFLSIVDKCVEKRMKLLGFLDERAINVNQNVTTLDWASLYKKPVAVQADPVEDTIKRLEERANGDGQALDARGEAVPDHGEDSVQGA